MNDFIKTYPQNGNSANPFREMFYPESSLEDWSNWKWQLRNRITTSAEFERIFELSEREREAIRHHRDRLPLAVTPYYASLMARGNPNDPLRKTVLPVPEEFIVSPEELMDPLGEENLSPVRSIVHRYPDRVLFLVTQNCQVYCRYCTRGRLVGQPEERFSKENWREGLEYLRNTPQVRDVLLSGGDGLFLEDKALEWLLTELRAIPHIEIVRIGTKAPMVLPQRVTPRLAAMLKKHHPLMISVHVAHPAELTPESREACERLADAGIPLGSQTVLLRGINDSIDVIKPLTQKLLTFRVRPYALYQCDPIFGSAHFRTPVSKGLEILKGLRGLVSGYSVPHFIIDPPGGGGKIALTPDAVAERTAEGYWLENFRGEKVFYPEIQ